MRTMRTLGTLVVIGGTVGLAYGCSAAGNAPIGSDTTDGSTPAANYGSDSDEAGTSGTAPKKDAGIPRTDGGGSVYDAGPPRAPEGSPCNPALGFSDPQATETCGACGTQTRICQGSAPDGGGSFTWAAWGICSAEVAGGCDPSKTYPASACGNCGTVQQVCGFDCHFEDLDCTEPVGACFPTDTKFVLGASCTTAGQGRLYTCGSTCTYGTPSACEVPPPNPHTLTIASAVGSAVTANFALSSGTTTGRIDADCPTTVDPSNLTPFIDIAIVNPTARTVTVDVWDGPSSGGADMDTIMAWYPSPVYPPTDMTACTSASDDCSGTDCANTGSHLGWSALSGSGNAVSIAAGQTVTVYVGGYTSSVTGTFTLHAKTTN